MVLKVLLVDTDEQFCFDTGIELTYDFDMLYLSATEDIELVGLNKFYKKQQHRLIVNDICGKMKVDDSDEIETLYNSGEEP